MERYELAVKWVCEAGDMLRLVQRDSLDIAEKSSHQDIVTKCDREIEDFLRQKINVFFPDDRIVGEEYAGHIGCDESKKGAVWFIDPIDGTTNFVNQHCNYAVSVGCLMDGSPLFGIVYDVDGERLYTAVPGQGAWMNGRPLQVSQAQNIKDMLLTTPCVTDIFLEDYQEKRGLCRLSRDVRAVRSLGSVALELCEVASGRADLCIAMKSSPWDHNGARVILSEAGGTICRLNGAGLPYDTDSAFIAGNSGATVALAVEVYLKEKSTP